MPRRALALVVVLAPCCGPVTDVRAGERWRRPVEGRVVAGFAYDREAPFVAGRRRGIDLVARPGAVVRAACSGRVSFAGRVPGRASQGVTVRCGRLVATHLGLVPRVRRGVAVARGAPVGVLGASGVLRLGARQGEDRFGYVDPRALLGGGGPPVPVPVPALRPGRRSPGLARRVARRPVRTPPPVLAPRLVGTPRPVPAPRHRIPRAAPRPERVPAGVLAGASLLALAGTFGVGASLTLRRGERRAPARAVTPS